MIAGLLEVSFLFLFILGITTLSDFLFNKTIGFCLANRELLSTDLMGSSFASNATALLTLRAPHGRRDSAPDRKKQQKIKQ
jgi:hypothetical protein